MDLNKYPQYLQFGLLLILQEDVTLIILTLRYLFLIIFTKQSINIIHIVYNWLSMYI